MDLWGDGGVEEAEDTPIDGTTDPRLGSGTAINTDVTPKEEEEVESSEPKTEVAEVPEEKKAAPVIPPVTVGVEKPELDYNTKYSTEYINSVKEVLRHNHIQYKEDGTDLEVILNNIGKEHPLVLNNIVDYAKREAKTRADRYQNEKITPYQRQEIQNQINIFADRLTKTFPDVKEYYPQFAQIYKDVICTQYPELRDNPIMSMPLIYAIAKSKAVGEVADQLSGKKATLEKGAAQRIKGASVNKSKSETHFDKIANALAKGDSDDAVDLWSPPSKATSA